MICKDIVKRFFCFVLFKSSIFPLWKLEHGWFSKENMILRLQKLIILPLTGVAPWPGHRP